MSRFAFDVNVAFLNAESTEEERIPVRMPEGCRKYCPKTGQELYGLLKKNLYGSPLAPKNWAKCRDQFMRELNQRDGWTVKQMNYAPCMWSIDIDNGGTTERTYVLIHTDDICLLYTSPSPRDRG